MPGARGHAGDKEMDRGQVVLGGEAWTGVCFILKAMVSEDRASGVLEQ